MNICNCIKEFFSNFLFSNSSCISANIKEETSELDMSVHENLKPETVEPIVTPKDETISNDENVTELLNEVVEKLFLSIEDVDYDSDDSEIIDILDNSNEQEDIPFSYRHY